MISKSFSKKIFLFIFISGLFYFIIIKNAEAHCPLCTAGAAGAVGIAAWLGVSKIILGLLVGAFGISTGWWMTRLIKKKIIPYQDTIIILASYLLTIIPILPLVSEPYAYYVSIMGGYGTLLNRTYLIDLSFITSIFGGIIVALAPSISKKITKMRNGKMIPYQGIGITFGLLFIFSLIIQIISEIF